MLLLQKPVSNAERYKYFHEECFDQYEEYKNEQYDMICPYCGYEYEGCEKPYEEETEDTECPCCGKTFTYEASFTWSWKTYKREEDFSEVEE